jgi:amino acid transporter
VAGNSSTSRASRKIGLAGAISIAVGTMIGASIFSIFGLGARIAGQNLPVVFILSGALALPVAYSYAVLGSRIVSNAGPIEFILRGIGDGLLAGTLSILMWFTYVVSIALFTKGFVGYFMPMVGIASTGLNRALLEAGLISVFTALGLAGSRSVGRTEFFIVVAKVSVLLVFIALGIRTLRPAWIVPAFSASQVSRTIEGMAIFFLSYMGFGLVTNASENMEHPERNVGRAIYLSLLIVTVIYVLVATVAVGNVRLPELVKAQDYALAEAAKPFLGRFGYVLVSLGALFSISSALNATLYGGANIAYALARDGELPDLFERKTWFGGVEGLYLTAGLGLAFAIVLNLSGIASITSAVFMVVYVFVLVSHYRLIGRYGGRRWVILTGIVSVMMVFVILMIYQWRTNRPAFIATFGTFFGAFVVEMIYRRITSRRLRGRGPASPRLDDHDDP